jgi:hypothetical protein
MSIDGMYSYDGSASTGEEKNAGPSGSTKSIVGFGGMISTPIMSVHNVNSFSKAKSQSVSTSRDSSTSYSYTVNFGYSFSTSSDPFLAGYACHVIVGGGVDLKVSQALAGKKPFVSTNSSCLLCDFFVVSQ